MTKRVSDCRMIWRDNNCGAQGIRITADEIREPSLATVPRLVARK